MSSPRSADIGPLLEGARTGDVEAFGQLVAVVQPELRNQAQLLLHGERPEHTLQPTALVNEVWLRLMGSRSGPTWENRRTFFKGTATAMRRVLVDHARRRGRAKRGGGREREPLQPILEGLAGEPLAAPDVLDLHGALEQLAEVQERSARVVELRVFAGLTIEEVAEVLDVSTGTVELDWRSARAWLRQRLEGGHEH